MSRHDARECTLQLLYQLDLQPGDRAWQIEDFIAQIAPRREDLFVSGSEENQDDTTTLEDDYAYIRRTVEGAISRAEELDQIYGEHLRDWTSSRIPAIDRAILRLATYEILYEPDVPYKVAINEAVRLAKRYAAEDSRQYINAVLGKIERPTMKGDEPMGDALAADNNESDT